MKIGKYPIEIFYLNAICLGLEAVTLKDGRLKLLGQRGYRSTILLTMACLFSSLKLFL